MTGQVEQFAIPLPTKFYEDRREYLAGEYNRLVAKIGEHASTDLRNIISLAIVHTQLTEVIEKLAARETAERSEVQK